MTDAAQAQPIVARRPARPRSAFALYLIALGLTWVGALLMQVRFLPLAELGEDDFQSQLLSVMVSLQQGTLVEGSSEGMLIYLHLLPLLGVLAFLAAAGVAYLVLYLRYAGARRWYLWLGMLRCRLSSASLRMGALLPFAASGARRYAIARWRGLFLLPAALVISAADKVAGFGAGESGYEAHGIAAENAALVGIGGSTIVTSVVEGQYARALVYCLGAPYLLFKADGLLRDLRRLPGIALERPGMLGQACPLRWLFLRFHPAAWPRVKGRSA